MITAAGMSLMFFTPIVIKEAQGDGSISRIISSILYGLPLCFLLSAIRKRWLMLTLSGILFLTSFIETMMVVLFRNYIISGNIIAIMTTTMDEGGGFIRSSIHALPYSLPVLAGMFLVVHGARRQRHAYLHLACAAITLTLSAAFILYQLHWRWADNITPRFYITQNVWSRPPYNFFYQASESARQMRLKQRIAEF